MKKLPILIVRNNPNNVDDKITSYIIDTIFRGAILTEKGGKYKRKNFHWAYYSDNDNLDNIIIELKPKIIISLGLFNTLYFFGEDVNNVSLGKAYRYNAHGFETFILPISDPINKVHENVLLKILTIWDNAIKYATGLIKKLPGMEQVPHKIINSLREFEQVLDYCVQTKTFCFDFEATGLEWYNKEIVPTCLSIAFQPGFGYVMPLIHPESKFKTEKNIIKIFRLLQDKIFSNPDVDKIAHNLKYDLHWMLRYGITLFLGTYYDTMLMQHLMDEVNRVGLKALTQVFFLELAGYEDEVQKVGYANASLELLAKYSAIDTDITLRLKYKLEAELLNDDPDNRLYIYYRNLTMPTLWTLLEAEHTGAKVDKALVLKSYKEAGKILKKKRKKLLSYQEVKRFEQYTYNKVKKETIEELKEKRSKHTKGSHWYTKYSEKIKSIRSGDLIPYEGINLNSNPQLADLLYSKEGFNFKAPKINGEVKHTTSVEYIRDFDHPFIIEFLTYRSIEKLVGTYIKGLIPLITDKGYVHTSFLLHGTVSGRLSSRNPNLQNIPARPKWEDKDYLKVLKMIKQFFVAEDGSFLAQFDYSQAELRGVANFSRDKNMMDAYLNGIDLHALTASKYSNMTIKEFNQLDPKERYQQRQRGKMDNFSVIYDVSPKGYAAAAKKDYGITVSETQAKKNIVGFFKLYPALRVWHKKYVSKARKYGYVRTLLGRKRRLIYIKSSNGVKRSHDERAAINSPIQGTCSEYVLFSISLLRWRLPRKTRLSNTVHDSIFYQIGNDIIKLYYERIKYTCENLDLTRWFNVPKDRYPIPMKVDLSLSDKSWGDQKEIENLDEFLKEYLPF